MNLSAAVDKRIRSMKKQRSSRGCPFVPGLLWLSPVRRHVLLASLAPWSGRKTNFQDRFCESRNVLRFLHSAALIQKWKARNTEESINFYKQKMTRMLWHPSGPGNSSSVVTTPHIQQLTLGQTSWKVIIPLPCVHVAAARCGYRQKSPTATLEERCIWNGGRGGSTSWRVEPQCSATSAVPSSTRNSTRTVDYKSIVFPVAQLGTAWDFLD
jgi:hypothetical protein